VKNLKKIPLLASLVAALIGGVAVAADPPAEADPGALKTIMVDLGEQMTRVQTGLWVEDFVAISAGAKAVAEHPHVSPEERTRIQAALGEDFAAFAQADRKVHDDAVRLAAAADAEALDATLKEVVELQSDCVSCHTQFKQRLAR